MNRHNKMSRLFKIIFLVCVCCSGAVRVKTPHPSCSKFSANIPLRWWQMQRHFDPISCTQMEALWGLIS